MRFDEEAYISPEELRKKGLIRRNDGTYYMRSALEVIYEETNWLRRFRRPFWLHTALNRLTAGKRLSADHARSGAETAKAQDMRKSRVDGGGSFRRPEYMDDAEERFIRAMQAIRPECRRVVEKVCLDEKVIVAGEARLLCMGLDDLVRFYCLGQGWRKNFFC